MTLVDARSQVLCGLAHRACIAMLLILLCPAPAAAADRYEGLAYAPRSGALLYRETHWQYVDRGTAARLVVYRCPNGDAFARKQVFDRPNGMTPDFEFIDGRDGYREGVRNVAGEREVFWQSSGRATSKQRRIQPGPDAVIDAGFDALVRSNWATLMAGKTVTAQFLLPSSQDFLEVIIQQQPGTAATGTTRLRMRLGAWYGFIAPDVELVYRLRDRWLLRFTGTGSIRNAAGRHQVVRIEFPDKYRVPRVGETEIASAMKTPLTGRCAG